jgi:menaquinone-dependent protoporphyrinogen oxidase
VLIGTASRHGSLPAQHGPEPAGFNAVLVESAVDAGAWLEPARECTTHFAGPLRDRPVSLFSSGPTGEAPFPPDEPYDITSMTAITRARVHRGLPGRLDPASATGRGR